MNRPLTSLASEDLKVDFLMRAFGMCFISSRVTQHPAAPPYHPPVKRSVAIDGHKTSISLEPLFWDMLKAAAEREDVPVSTLVARIDAERIRAETPPGLASAIRVWLVSRQAESGTDERP